LLELILSRFGEVRMAFYFYMVNPGEVDDALFMGAEKAKGVADEVLARVRAKVGY
jgi:tryptophanyl-tRNA synthetase